MRSSKEEMSQLAAELLAVVCVECQDTSVHLVTVINDLVTDTRSKVCSIVVCHWNVTVCFMIITAAIMPAESLDRK